MTEASWGQSEGAVMNGGLRTYVSEPHENRTLTVEITDTDMEAEGLVTMIPQKCHSLKAPGLL